jgi:hypothetical protein
MNKRNVTFAALVLAALITGLFMVFPPLNRILEIFYVPAILLTAVLSSDIHSPSGIAGWTAFAGNTLFFGVVFVVLYAFLSEFALMRRAKVSVGRHVFALRAGDGDSGSYLEAFGRAVAELEAKRRKRFLLQGIDAIDLSQSPAKVGAQAIALSHKKRPIKKLLKRFESEVARSEGADKAASIMQEMQQRAQMIEGVQVASPGQPASI